MPPTPTRLRVIRLEDRTVPTAGLQVINASPAAAGQTVDVYINGNKQVDNLLFRQSTPFITVADSQPLKIDIVAGADPTNARPLVSQTVTLPANAQAIAAVVGDPGQAAGTAGAVKLAVAANGRSAGRDPANVDVLILHASPDSPAADVKIRGTGTVANDIGTGAFAADYVSVPAGRYILDVTQADGVTPVGSFVSDLTGQAGKAVVAAVSGFATPATGSATLGLLQVASTGMGTLYPRTAGFAPTRYAVGGTNSATLYAPTGQPVFRRHPRRPAGSVVDRVAAADVTGDGVDDLIVGSGPGVASQVTVYDGKTQAVVFTFAPFEAAFTGGVFVAAADLNNDGKADIVTTPDQGGGPRVQIRTGADGTQLIPDFFGIVDPAFRGGARAALADLNADGTPDLIVGAGFGGGPRISGYNGRTLLPGGTPGQLFGDFFAFEPTLRNGAYVAGGDINGDGYADLVSGGGPGGGPRVYALSGKDLTATGDANRGSPTSSPADINNRDGVRVAVKDLDGDYRADIVTGLGSPGVPQVRTFLGKTVTASNTPAATTDNSPFGTPPIGGGVRGVGKTKNISRKGAKAAKEDKSDQDKGWKKRNHSFSSSSSFAAFAPLREICLSFIPHAAGRTPPSPPSPPTAH